MTSNPEEIIQEIRRKFAMMLAVVSGDLSPLTTACEIESGLLKRLLKLGRALLLLLFCHALKEFIS